MSDYKKKILKDLARDNFFCLVFYKFPRKCLVCEFHDFVSPDVQVIDFDKIL